MVHLKNAALKALWFLSVFAIAWFSYDVRDFWLAHQPYSYTVAPGSLQWEPPVYNWDGSRSGFILADYFTPFGGLPPADGTTICASGTASSICNPVTANLNVNSASWTLTDQATATGGTLASSATTNDIVGWNHTCAGCTASGAGLAGGVAGFVNPNVANVNTLSFTGGAATTPYIFEFQGTSAKPVLEIRVDGTCTGAQHAIFFQNGGNTNFFVNCNGNVQTAGTLTLNQTTANEIDSNSTGAVPAFQMIATNASLPTGDWLDVCSGTAGTCTNKELAVVNGGAVQARPTINGANTISTLPNSFAVSAGGVASTSPGTFHIITGSCTFSASTTCDTSTQAGGAVWAGSAVFNAVATTVCVAVPTSTTGQITYAISTTKLVMTATSNSATVPYSCWGP